MTPADVQRMIAEKGETITLRRGDPPGNVDVDVAVKARVVGFEPHELVGDIKQGDRRVVIGHAEIAAAATWTEKVVKIGDRLIIGGKIFTVGAPDPRKLGDDIAGWWLVARG